MKNRAVLSILLVVLLTVFAPSADAWHFECNYGGDMMFNSGQDFFTLEESLGMMADAGWEVTNACEGPGGSEIIVEYDIWGGWWDWYASGSGVSFRVVSDYGNTTPQSIDVYASGEAWGQGFVHFFGHDYGLEADGQVDIFLDSDFGPGLDLWLSGLWGSDWDSVEEIFEIQTYTDYYIDALLSTEIWAEIVCMPPDWFEDWDAYDAFFGGTEQGWVWAEIEGDLSFELYIESVEIPLPSTLLLFGSGFIAMTVKKKRKG